MFRGLKSTAARFSGFWVFIRPHRRKSGALVQVCILASIVPMMMMMMMMTLIIPIFSIDCFWPQDSIGSVV